MVTTVVVVMISEEETSNLEGPCEVRLEESEGLGI